jgi:hypothetical protein
LKRSSVEAPGAERSCARVLRNPEGDYAAQLRSQRTALDLTRSGLTVFRLAEPPEPGRDLLPGDYVVPVQEGWGYAAAALGELPADQKVALTTDCEIGACRLRFPRIVLDAHPWAGFYRWYHDVLRAGNFRFSHMISPDARELAGHDLVVVPGGGGLIPDGYARAMREHVRGGGNYVGSCFGAAQAIYPSKVSYSPEVVGASLIEVENVEIVRSYGALGGTGAIVVANRAADHPVMFGLPEEFHTQYWNGPVMKPRNGTARVLAVLKKAEFTPRHPEDASEEYGKAIWLAGQRPGEGKVVVFGDHPESVRRTRIAGTARNIPNDLANRGVHNAVLWCSSGETEKVELRPAAVPAGPGWLRPAEGSSPVSARLGPAERRAAVLRRDFERRGFTRKSRLTHSLAARAYTDLRAIIDVLPAMRMKRGADAAGLFARRREELLEELIEFLAGTPRGYAPRLGEMRHMPTELCVRFEEWGRDYRRFAAAAGRRGR